MKPVMLILALATPAIAHDHGYLIHANLETGDLEIEFEWEDSHHLDMQSPDLPGWWTDELSFEEVLADPNDPHYNPDWAGLTPGAKIQLVLDSFDIGLFAHDHDDHAIQYGEGESVSLGTGFTDFTKPIIWRLDPATPGFDPTQPYWSVRFHIRDAAGLHADSPMYEFRVTPSPAGAVVLAGGLAFRRRRRN